MVVGLFSQVAPRVLAWNINIFFVFYQIFFHVVWNEQHLPFSVFLFVSSFARALT